MASQIKKYLKLHFILNMFYMLKHVMTQLLANFTANITKYGQGEENIHFTINNKEL
jgi:hypothetical protein